MDYSFFSTDITDGMLCTKLIVECYIIAACKKHDKNFLYVPVLAATLRQCLCYDKNMDNLGGPVIDKVLWLLSIMDNLSVTLFSISFPPVLLKKMKIDFLKSMPLMLLSESMKGLMASIIPLSILSISSNMNSDCAHSLTLPRIQFWICFLYTSVVFLFGKS